MRIRNIVSFLAFIAIIVFAVGYLAVLGVRVNPPENRTNLTMVVDDVNGLVPGANVLLRGVPVGKVSSVGTSVTGASIDFYVDSRYRVPVDSEVRLENLSALGESYIGLVPRTEGGAMLANGQRVATEHVVAPASISELSTSIVRVLDQLEPGALQRIIAEGDTALPDPAVVLPNISRASTLLRNTVAGFNGKGATLLDNFQSLLANAGFVGPILADAAPRILNIAKDFQTVYTGYGVAVANGAPQTVVNFNALLMRVQNFLDDRGGDLKVLVATMQPQLNAIAGALMNVDSSQVLNNLLDAVPPDGTVTLRVAMP